MKQFYIISLVLVSFSVLASEFKKIPANDHPALAREGITILSEEHIKTSGVSSSPPVEIEIKKPISSEINSDLKK